MKDIKCPYCNSDKVEFVDLLDRHLDSYNCNECEEYFYVEMNGSKVIDVRKKKWS